MYQPNVSFDTFSNQVGLVKLLTWFQQQYVFLLLLTTWYVLGLNVTLGKQHR